MHLEIAAPGTGNIVSKDFPADIKTGGIFTELGNFEADTSAAGAYNISADIYDGEKVVTRRTAQFKVLEQISSVYTNDVDFDKGILKGVNHDEIHNQLQLNKYSEVFPYIWIANAAEGTLSKLDTTTGREVARYRTGPSYTYPNPSRTTVDKEGNCWVGNRGIGTVVKVSLSGGVDKNGNGKIDTSTDLNNNGVIDSNEILPWGQDEAVVANVQVGSGSNSLPRALAIDNNGRLWVGLYNDWKFVVLNEADGSDTGIRVPTKAQSYGASIDSNGVLWSSAISQNCIEKIDTNNPTQTKTYSIGTSPYGIVVDKNGIVWTAGYQWNAPLVRFDPKTERYDYHYGYGDYGR